MIIRNSKQILLKIKGIIAENDLKAKDVAKKINLTDSAFSQRLKQDNISIDSIVEICDAINYDLEINLIKKDDTK